MAARADPLLLPIVIVSLVRLTLVILALGLVTIMLDIPIEGMANSERPLARFASRLIQVAALLFWRMWPGR